MNDAALTSRIRVLNDLLRRTAIGGRLVMTAGVASQPPERMRRLWQAVASFTAFDDGNDPHGEHDFGAFEDDGQTFFWKIDYYDRDLRFGSPNPSDPSVTMRVLTLMLAEEY